MTRARTERIGTIVRQASGMNAVCTEYRSNTDITIRLDNGNLIHTTWQSFSKGILRAADDHRKESREGQSRIQNCGKILTCIVYRAARDCDFQFEDGEIVRGRCWSEFVNGSIDCKKERVGVKIKQHCGQVLTCIAYRGNTDCDFQFEDGYIVKNKRWANFVRGNISRNTKASRIGQRKMQQCGQEAECIAYRTVKDCDFRFDDGHIIRHALWDDFARGVLPYSHYRDAREQRVGISKMQNCGKEASCIHYRKSDDCDFQFQDGKILRHRAWDDFISGRLRYNTYAEDAAMRVGISRTQNCGLAAVCVRYHTWADADFQFPDGQIRAHRSWDGFMEGRIAHPLFTAKTGSSDFYGYTVHKAFTDARGNVYYRCTNNETGEKSIQVLSDLIPKEQL